MIDEPTREDAALYALDLLAGSEHEVFERNLTANAELAAYVDELRDSATQLVKALPRHEPPARLRVNLLNAAREEFALREYALGGSTTRIEPALTPAASVLPPSSEAKIIPMPRPAWHNYVPWTLAACLGVMAAVSAATSQRLAQDLASLREDNLQSSQAIVERERVMDELRQSLASVSGGSQRLEKELAQLREESARSAQALKEGKRVENELRASLVSANQENDLLNLRVATLTSDKNPQSLASVVWNTTQKKGVIHVEKLAQTTGAAVYQLWAIGDKPGAVPVSAGTFTVSGEGATTFHFQPSMEVTDLSTFAVTLEPQSGLTAPLGPVVLVGKM